MSIPQSTEAWIITKLSGGFGSLQKQTKDLPKSLAPNEVLVKIHATSLNYRDLIIPRGEYPFPATPGVIANSDGAGEVVATGSKVQSFKAGDKVVTLFNQGHLAGPVDLNSAKTGLGGAIDGTLTKYAVLPETGILHMPSNLNYSEAATLTCAGLTAWNALYGLKQIKPGDSILVQGTGGVSIFALQFAKAAGAFIVATTSSSEKAKTLKQLGADHVLNYKTTPEWGQAARDLTPGKAGFDNIIEVGGPSTLRESFKCIKMEGIISMIGFVAGTDDVEPSALAPLSNICTVRGIYVGPRDQMVDMNRAVEHMNIKPIVDREFAFEEAVDAYEYVYAQKHIGKVVIKVQ